MSSYKSQRQSWQTGTALFELMLALGLGTILIAAAITSYQHIIRQYQVSENQFTTLTTSMIIESIIDNDLHAAVGQPCSGATRFANIVTNGETTYWLDLFNRPLQIYDGNDPAAEAIRRHGSQSGDRVTNSDLLVALTVQMPTALTHHNIAHGYFDLLSPLAFEAGGFAVVCDQQVAVLFQITKVSNAGQRLSYVGDNVSPGNCASRFDPDSPCATHAAYRFSSGTLVAPFRPQVLFVGVSPDPKQYSLYRERLSLYHYGSLTKSLMRREEIIPGVVVLKARSVAANNLPRGLDIGLLVAGQHPANQPSPPKRLLGEALTTLPNRWWLFNHEFSVAL